MAGGHDGCEMVCDNEGLVGTWDLLNNWALGNSGLIAGFL